jgi:hypothetical protein
LFSRYERVTDRRTFKDRRDVWAIEKAKNESVPAEKPKAKIKQVEEVVKSKSKANRQAKKEAEEVHEEQPAEEQHQEEEPAAEEEEKQNHDEEEEEEEPAAEE